MVGRSVVVLTALAGALVACGGEDGTGQTGDAGLMCEDTTPLVRPSGFGPCDAFMQGTTWHLCTATATTAHGDPECASSACLADASLCVESAVRAARDCAACRQCPPAVFARDEELACVAKYRDCVTAALDDAAKLEACRQGLICQPAPGLPIGCPS